MQNASGDRSLFDLPDMGDIESLAKGYLLNCRCENKSPATIEGYRRSIHNFVWYCHQHDLPTEPQRLTLAHVRSFLWYVASEPNRWQSKPLVASKPADSATVNKYYRHLRTFFNWLKAEQLIAVSPCLNLKPPKTMKKVVRALSSSELDLLLSAYSANTKFDVRNKAILTMFVDTGLRVGELLNLKLDDIDMKNGAIVVQNGKGAKQRIVRMGMKAQKALWRYLTVYRNKRPGYLFYDRSGNHMTQAAVRKMLETVSQATGIEDLHAHRLRHTFAIYFLRAGGDVFSLQYLLGHTTLQMTQRYLQSLNADDARKTHERCSPIDNLGAKR